MVCRNPLLTEQRKREALLRSTEALLDPIVAATRHDQRRLQGQEKIALRVGKVIGKYKMAKHFDLKITEGSFGYRRKLKAITREAALDGLYIVRTSLPASELDAPGTVSAYRRLSQVECAFHSFKTVDLKVRPSSTIPPTRCVHMSCCVCSRTTWNGLCAKRWRRCCSTTTRPVPRPHAPRSWRRPGFRHGHRIRPGANARQPVGRCTASAPCSTPWPPSLVTASSRACLGPNRSMCSLGPPRYSARPSDCSAFDFPVGRASSLKRSQPKQYRNPGPYTFLRIARHCAYPDLSARCVCIATYGKFWNDLVKRCITVNLITMYQYAAYRGRNRLGHRLEQVKSAGQHVIKLAFIDNLVVTDNNKTIRVGMLKNFPNSPPGVISCVIHNEVIHIFICPFDIPYRPEPRTTGTIGKISRIC